MGKKSFKDALDNPAELFITKPAEDHTEDTETEEPNTGNQTSNNLVKKPPEGYKLNPLFVEIKSRRLQLLIKPSIFDKLKARAKREGTSLNNLVNEILETYTKGE